MVEAEGLMPARESLSSVPGTPHLADPGPGYPHVLENTLTPIVRSERVWHWAIA